MDYSKEIINISNNLRKSAKVNSYDTNIEKESDTLAHSFMDMEESFKVIVNDLLPKLRSDNISQSEIDETLLDIGEELRHILYHIKDPKYFRYLIVE